MGKPKQWLIGAIAVAAVLPPVLAATVLGVPAHLLLTPQGIANAAREFWRIVGPGGQLHPAYFLEHKGHLVIEGLLAVIIMYLFLQHSFKPKARSEEPLTEKEIDQLCKEWKPEPLVPTLAEQDKLRTRVVTGYQGKHVVVDGKKALDLATFNFLNLGNNANQLEVARKTVDKYGVGSCGPRGFYGTIDVHLHLESALAKFMGTDEAIIYSYDIATASSVVPAFANRRDVLVVDELCSFPIQQGALLSRAQVLWFKHNDMADLERLLKQVDADDKRKKKPLNRRIILVEGVYGNVGDLAPLRQLYELKEKYKWRLMVEETHSFGVLGKTGRGAVEHAGLRPDQVEIICGSMGTVLGSVGGFCVGSNEIVEHQRLSGLGYCFSASLPPYLATAAHASLDTLADKGPSLLGALRKNAAAMRRELKKVPGWVVAGGGDAEVSPLIHLHLAKPPADARAHEELLHNLAAHMLKSSGVMVTVPVYSCLERSPPPPGLRMCVSAALEDADITAAVNALKKATKELV
mmetsp:Transcript_35360/g.89524  ORF Transcript_35360/g.89524 Transcript_35360/m.89524 type:complete len:520 (-) Transcript_35360:455-2014(-)|eukprot:CAMPEP_0202867850 /NCGR_PEP_ID=MMETSP1391-20130828/9658_1 /ASSEMBLY_ACC=CAM_ASM_000867 /TAXON_ID=1034604 /ORGANISM="Chlamydomonas leiostraca, Strain SAG 11-49" /LENGTH=519 /DNA_ID=CAMNT_0049547927 /DNA_START=69 /DNA_END=1628 /DNA_ORIENTATION=+